MKEGVFKILGIVFLVIGLVLLVVGIFMLINSFSALTGYAVSDKMDSTATNFLGIWFLLTGIILIVSWGTYLISNKE